MQPALHQGPLLAAIVRLARYASLRLQRLSQGWDALPPLLLAALQVLSRLQKARAKATEMAMLIRALALPMQALSPRLLQLLPILRPSRLAARNRYR